MVGIPGLLPWPGFNPQPGTEVVQAMQRDQKNKWKLKIRNFNVIGVDFAQRSFSGRLEESLDLSLSLLY